ncbi:hypothetical protein V8E36_000949 [Tilletia maclaganii]
MPVTTNYPQFPQGDLWLKFCLSTSPDFRSVTDWCWRHQKRGERVHAEPLGILIWRSLACQGVLQCTEKDCEVAVRVPAQGTANETDDIGLMRHIGKHDHSPPDQRKLRTSEKEKLKQKVL